MYKVGIDIGGTFTDFVIITPENEIKTGKLPSSPPNYQKAIFEGVKKFKIPLNQTKLFVHGTTVATNAIIERKGAKTALITTKGFKDVISMGRGSRRNNMSFWWQPPQPLVRRSEVFEVNERTAYNGKILQQLNQDEVLELINDIREMGFEAVAISFIFSPTNQTNEIRAKELIQELLPDTFVTTAVEINPEILEYERSSTALCNAYVGPLMKNYLNNLDKSLKDLGLATELLLMSSSGGALPVGQTLEIPASTALSGLAGGVVAGKTISNDCGYPSSISFDIGGTSTDVSMVYKSEVKITTSWELGFGLPIRLPSVDVHTIGAGGGSIAWIDEGGSLRVGPQSAGANPGPACYNKGGIDATLTDAHLVLGRLNSKLWESIYGWPLDEELSKNAIQILADKLGLSLLECASGIIEIANSNLLAAIRLISIDKGYDPQEFVLIGFGGAGGLHSVDLGQELGASGVLVPPNPGVTSAFGLLTVDVRHDYAKAYLKPEKSIVSDDLIMDFEEMIDNAIFQLSNEGFDENRRNILLYADVRYYGRSNYLTVPVSLSSIKKHGLLEIVQEFKNNFFREFGYLMPEEVSEVEIVNIRVVAYGLIINKAKLPINNEYNTSQPKPYTNRKVYFPKLRKWVLTEIYKRSDLTAVGYSIHGPAIIEQEDSTTVIPPNVNGKILNNGTLLINV